MRLAAQRRVDRSRDHRVDAQVRAVLPFVGQFARERGDARLGHRVATPVRARLLAAVVEREHHARVRCVVEHRHQRARETHRRGDVHAQQREPAVERLVLDGPERPQQRGRVHQARRAGPVAPAAPWRRCRSRPPPPSRGRAAGSRARGVRRRRSRRRALRACARRGRAGPPWRRCAAQARASGAPRPPWRR